MLKTAGKAASSVTHASYGMDANNSREANNSRDTNDGGNTRPERMSSTAGLQQQHGCHKNDAIRSREVNNRKETPIPETPGTAGMSTTEKRPATEGS
jgi:hypothetical protein